jgi:hypothetical protein
MLKVGSTYAFQYEGGKTPWKGILVASHWGGTMLNLRGLRGAKISVVWDDRSGKWRICFFGTQKHDASVSYGCKKSAVIISCEELFS